MNLQLNDKVIMVAAGSKGLGFGIARAVARESARVSIASRNMAHVELALPQLKQAGAPDVLGSTFDASDAGSILAWTDRTLTTWGRIDGLVVNAGGPPPGTFDDFQDEDWLKAFNLTVLSAVRMIRSVLPAMRKARSGSILTITSTTIKEPISPLLLSNVMRSGVVSIVKTLSKDLAPQGIRINNLVPGRIDTERVKSLDTINAQKGGVSYEAQRDHQQKAIPLKRYGTIEEFGAAGAFLLSDAASYVTGATLVTDGGSTQTVW